MTIFGIIAALAAIPSASVALVVARSAALGVVNGLAVSLGIVLGDLVFVALALFGLSAAAETMGGLFFVIKVLGGLYLLWLGFSLLIVKSSARVRVSKSSKNSSLTASFVAGFLLTLGDIKAIMLYASLFPIFIDLSDIRTSEALAVVFITILGVGGVKCVYVIFSSRVAAFAENSNMEVAARKAAGGLMVGAGGSLIVTA
ncbi:LysE family transporter [Thiorhodococcus mannitoliphagus]|uniref:LysE family transporter n=2 Tax=Thiorhodococcus mannitoliphagus TaxID=329406 RepID=A0A6P1E0W8_9GAMM|nr:LysE family transporter [Thiorhodococcus mannitoliphagus]NEX22696.1 LysE family transporter [Thiorhodococcus mannitoliphagus]